ncbi:MAG: methyltransferase domain-containing protein [Bacteroidota bacterium]
MFTTRDIADYYNQTLNHYQNWWRLDNNLAVHYGIWDDSTRNFQDSLANTNKVLMDIADIKSGEKILDAGCGVGGSAFYLAKKRRAIVTGITLSEKQFEYATQKCKKLKIEDQVRFKIEDYTKTSFEDNSFDVVWAIESITSASDKKLFTKEAIRLLKPGGRLIIADYFKENDNQKDPDKLLEKWNKLWSMADFVTLVEYKSIFSKAGFSLKSERNVTKEITPTAKRMYWSYLLGGPLAIVYNLFNKPTPFARNHYKSGLYQYKALKQGLWNYSILLFEKDIK